MYTLLYGRVFLFLTGHHSIPAFFASAKAPPVPFCQAHATAPMPYDKTTALIRGRSSLERQLALRFFFVLSCDTVAVSEGSGIAVIRWD
jgi:hypothetical protein